MNTVTVYIAPLSIIIGVHNSSLRALTFAALLPNTQLIHKLCYWTFYPTITRHCVFYKASILQGFYWFSSLNNIVCVISQSSKFWADHDNEGSNHFYTSLKR